MKVTVLICRILLGLMFVVFGANILHPFLPMPQTSFPPLVQEFNNAMMASGWMKIIGLFQILGGVLVLFEGLVPLGLCILCPMTVNIICFHMAMLGANGIGPAVLAVVMELVLLYAYRASFKGILSAHEKPVYA